MGAQHATHSGLMIVIDQGLGCGIVPVAKVSILLQSPYTWDLGFRGFGMIHQNPILIREAPMKQPPNRYTACYPLFGDPYIGCTTAPKSLEPQHRHWHRNSSPNPEP